MPSATDSRFAVPGFISLLVILGIVAVGKQSFEPLRPSAKETIDYGESTYTRVEARLWQDPFNAVQAFDDSATDAIETYRRKLFESDVPHRVIDESKADLSEAAISEDRRLINDFFRDCSGDPKQKEISTTGQIRCPRLPDYLRAFNKEYASELIHAQLQGELRAMGVNDATKVLLLPVTLPVGDYADLIERRRRSRYAVVSALTEQGFLPNDGEHLRVLRSPRELCGIKDNCQSSAIPYEYFRLKTSIDAATTSDSGARWMAIVLWVEDRDILRSLLPLVTKLRNAICINCSASRVTKTVGEIEGDPLAQADLNAGQETAVSKTFLLGPYSSSNLSEGRITEAEAARFTENNIHVINWSSTNRQKSQASTRFWTNTISRDEHLLYGLTNVVDRRVRGVFQVRDPVSANSGDGPGNGSVIQTSDNPGNTTGLKVALKPNLASDPSKPIDPYAQWDCTARVADSRAFSATATATADRTVLLLAESDTGYASAQYKLAKQCFEARGYRVWARSYVRGIDGQYPGHTPDNAVARSLQSPSSLDVSSVTASLLASGYRESSAGTGQFDYLRRLAKGLGEENRQVDAIGVLGSDPYDKVLVLQALRSEFPDAVYFTTDLYSLFLREDSFKIYKNLLVASSHNLELLRTPSRSGSGRIGAPLRDSYQTSLYEAVTLAAIDAIDQQNSTLLKHTPAVRIFEIGRGDSFELSQGLDLQRLDDHSPKPALDYAALFASAAIHLLVAALLAFAIQTYLASYRSALPTPAEAPSLLGLSGACGLLFALLAISAALAAAGVGAEHVNLGVKFAPSVYEQTAAACILAFCCAASLVLLTLRPFDMLDNSEGAETVEIESTEWKAQVRAAIALVIVACFAVSYIIVWLLPALVGRWTGEVWSLLSGVSVWPSFGCSALILLICGAAFFFIGKRSSFLAEDLSDYLGLESPDFDPAPASLLSRIKGYHGYLTGDARQVAGYNAYVVILALLFVVIFAFIAVVANRGSFPRLSWLGGSGTVDLVQVVIVTVVAVFSARLFLLGRESRLIMDAIRCQTNQRASVRLRADALSLAADATSVAAEKGEIRDLDDGPLEPHAAAFFAQTRHKLDRNPKISFRAERFSHSVRNSLVDIELVEMITRQVQRLFYLPVFILVLFAVAALPLFDRWPVSQSVLLFGGFLTTALVLQAWRLDYVARSIKRNLIDVIGARITSVDHMTPQTGMHADFKRMLQYAEHTIESEHDGAFLPLTALPLVRILIVTVGALGLILSQAILGIGYSL